MSAIKWLGDQPVTPPVATGVVWSTFCIGSKLLAQFDVPTATEIATRLLARDWTVLSTAINGNYTTTTVRYTHSASTPGNPYTVPAGFFVLVDVKLANFSGSPDPWGSAVTIKVTNDPAVLKTYIGVQASKFSTQFANLYPLFPVPPTCTDGSNPNTGAPAPAPTPLPVQTQPLPQQIYTLAWPPEQIDLMQIIFAREMLRLLGPTEGTTTANRSKAYTAAKTITDAYTQCPTSKAWATSVDALKALPCMAWWWMNTDPTTQNSILSSTDCASIVSALLTGSQIHDGSQRDCAGPNYPIDPLYNTVAGVLAVKGNPSPYPCPAGTVYYATRFSCIPECAPQDQWNDVQGKCVPRCDSRKGFEWDLIQQKCVQIPGGGSTEPLPMFDQIGANKVIRDAVLQAQTKCSGVKAGTAIVTVTYANSGAPGAVDITPDAFDTPTRECVLNTINDYLLLTEHRVPAFAGAQVPLTAVVTLTGPAAPVWSQEQKDIMRLAVAREDLRHMGPHPYVSTPAQRALADGQAFSDAVVKCANDVPWATNDAAVVEMRCLAGKWAQLSQDQKNALLVNAGQPGCATLTNIRGATLNLTCPPATLKDPVYNTVASLLAIDGKAMSPFSEYGWTDAQGAAHACMTEAGVSHWDEDLKQCVLNTTSLPGPGTCETGTRWDSQANRCVLDGCVPGKTHWDDRTAACIPDAGKTTSSSGGSDNTALIVLAVVGGIAAFLLTGGKAAAVARTQNPLLMHNPRVSRAKVSQAYYMLVELIAGGYEFPHAHERAVMLLKLNDAESTALLEEYDNEQARANPVHMLPFGNPHQRGY